MKETLEKEKGETKLKTPHKLGRKENKKQKSMFVQSFVLFPHS